MRHLAALGAAAHAAARLAVHAPPVQPDDPDDLSEEQKIMFSLISVGLVLLAGEFFVCGEAGGGAPDTRDANPKPTPSPSPPSLQASCPASPWACSNSTPWTWKCCAGRAPSASGGTRPGLSR